MGGHNSAKRFIALRDRRVTTGGVPSRPHLGIINVDENTPLGPALHQICAYAGRGTIHTMFILCHGYQGLDFAQQQSIAGVGGMGLMLGNEGVKHKNVARWIAIRGKVENIVVYACRAAQALPGSEGVQNDGKYLMGALAIHTQAKVYAGDENQRYSTYRKLKHGAFHVGGWEGQLWCFPPTGEGAIPVHKPPVDFDDVLGGGHVQSIV